MSPMPQEVPHEERGVKQVNIKSIKRYRNTENVYNLRIADRHNFFVNGVLTHNCDDPFKDRLDADSITIRGNVWKWWNSTFYPRRDGKAGVILLNTRWHMDDLTGRLLEQQDILDRSDIKNKMDRWERFTFPAIAEVDEYIDGELFRKQGEVLWPERFSIDDLEKTRSVTDVYEWSSLYQQSPILSENATFRKEWFKYYDPTDIKTKILRYYTLVDLAISQKKTADNTVVRTVGKDLATGYLYLMEETAGRLDPLQTIDAIFRHVKMYRSTVYIESVGYQASLPQFILEEQRKTQTYFNVEELKHGSRATKDSRISGLIPRYKSGVIFHRREDVDLEMELLQYPKGRHDDRCLVADTKVATLFGDKNISDVMVGDLVLTPLGVTKVINSACTGIVSVINNRGLIGTREHNVFTWGGWRNLQNITGDVILDTLSIKNNIIWTFLRVWSLMVLDIPLWVREDITSALPQLTQGERTLRGSMSLFMSSILGLRSRKALSSIIRIIIGLIMNLIIWCVYHVSNMLRNIQSSIKARVVKIIWIGLDHLQKHGMGQIEVRGGTVSTGKMSGKIGRSLRRFVLSAIENLRHIYPLEESSVTIAPAGKEDGGGLRKVYNLTTENGLYYANGILVSNCDCLSFVLEIMDETVFPESPEQKEHRIKEERETFDPHRAFNRI